MYDFKIVDKNFLWNAFNFSFVFLAGVLGPHFDLFGWYLVYWVQTGGKGKLKFDG